MIAATRQEPWTIRIATILDDSLTPRSACETTSTCDLPSQRPFLPDLFPGGLRGDDPPRLLDWQVEAALDNCLTVPAAERLTKEVPSILESVAEFLARLDRLLGPSAEFRGAVREPRLAEIRQALGEGKDLAIAVRQATASFEQLLEGLRKLEGARPSPAGRRAGEAALRHQRVPKEPAKGR